MIASMINGQMPPIPIVDGHVHFWDTTKLTYDWLSDCGELNAPMLPERMTCEIVHEESPVAFEITGMVQVQADCAPDSSFDEIEMVRSMSDSYPIKGMVAYAPLEEGQAVRPILERLHNDSFVRGVRRSTQNEPDGFACEEGYIEGLAMLGEYGLTADICARAQQLSDVTAAIRSVRERGSNTAVVIDHVGKPRIPDYPFTQWETSLRELAAIDGVHCKLSGLLPEVSDGQWNEQRIRPYLETAIDAFGIERVMFSGDWPIMKFVNATYKDWVSIVHSVVSPLGEAAVRAVFSSNATAFYGL